MLCFYFLEIDRQQFSDGVTMLLFQGEHNSAKDHGVVKLGKEVESQSNGEDIFECLVRLKKNLQPTKCSSKGIRANFDFIVTIRL